VFRGASYLLNMHSYRPICKNITSSKHFKCSCRSHTEVFCLQAWDIGNCYIYRCTIFLLFCRTYWRSTTNSDKILVAYVLPTRLFSIESAVCWIKHCIANPFCGIWITLNVLLLFTSVIAVFVIALKSFLEMFECCTFASHRFVFDDKLIYAK
jgi:hypothetical protein